MKFCFQLLPHANIRYRESLDALGQAELECLLSACKIDAQVRTEQISGCAFVNFEAEALTHEQLYHLSRHSALLMMCQQEGELLRPLERPSHDYLPPDLAEVLKYKGKTSAVFTKMMINCALAASDYFTLPAPTVLDPMVGRGTTCFTALQCGMNAVGVDLDRKDLKEAADYLSRYLQYHKLKHSLRQGSRTVKGTAMPEAIYTLADSKEHYQAGDTRSLSLYLGDTALTGELMRKTPAHVIVADLPYGVQHAPQAGKRTESFEQLLRRALKAWRSALKPGGAMALSFNALTLPRKKLIELVQEAGYEPLEGGPYEHFEHFVEQAVTRDVVIARKA